MGKIKIGFIVLGSMALVGLVLAGIVMAKNGSDNDRTMVRVIADTTSGIDKLVFKIRGCRILHELNDATALECSSDLVPKLKVREDIIYHIMDMGANSQINADDVWKLGYTGSGITVAVLDTGIDKDHPELISSVKGGKGFGYPDFEDDHGHGTHVSGIITADGVGGSPFGFAKGVAPDAGVWMAKVCNASGSCYSSDIAAAIEYVVKGPDGIPNNGDEPAKIISISLGGGGTTRANCDTDYLAKEVNWAVDNGVTVAAAAGNPLSGVGVSSPACASKAIAVGAVDKTDVRASWSGTGLALDIMAPGVSVYSTYLKGGYATMSGTSMSTPHISATVALLKQVNSALTDTQIKDALYKTANDLGATDWDKYYGWGRVDALAAVNYVKPPGPECTVGEDCDPKDSWYNVGSAYGCCDGDGNQVCMCQDQEYRDYYCSEGSCVYNVTNAQVVKTNCSACNDNNTCTDDSCANGACVYTNNTSSCDDGNPCTKGDVCSKGVCTGTPITECISGDGCCPAGCTYPIDTDCPAGVMCWSGSNQYLYGSTSQTQKFCKCAQGTYGYKSYSSKWLKSTVYKYVDTGNNEHWTVTSQTSYSPVYQVKCLDSVNYPTNKDYSYPK